MAMWMNLGRDFSGLGRTPGALADIARIETMWADTRARFGAGGPYLFGANFGAADAMFAPVVLRFVSYGVTLDPVSQAYADSLLSLPAMQQWLDEAELEQAATDA